jgi:hypothetical protein
MNDFDWGPRECHERVAEDPLRDARHLRGLAALCAARSIERALQPSAECLREARGYRVSDLAHRLAPSALEVELIGKALQPRRLTHSEVAHSTVVAHKHVLTTGNAMISGFQCLCRLVERRSRVPGICASAGLVHVIVRAIRLAKIGDGVAHGDPWKCGRGAASGFKSAERGTIRTTELCGFGSPAIVALPIFTGGSARRLRPSGRRGSAAAQCHAYGTPA